MLAFVNYNCLLFQRKAQIWNENKNSVVDKGKSKKPKTARVVMKAQKYFRDNGRDGPRKRIVITGMGIVSCFGTDVDVFYNKLLAGETGIKLVEGFSVDDLPTKIGGQIMPEHFQPTKYISAKQARRLDPVILYSLAAAKLAFENANLDSESLSKLNKHRCGCVVGSGLGGLNAFTDGMQKLFYEDYSRISPFFIPNTITNLGSAMIAIDCGFMGINYSVSTACATSNHAFSNAAMHIQRGEADLIVTGGSEASLTRVGLAGFTACRALSKRNDEPSKASRPWDTARDGFVMGEGCGVLIMESLEHAEQRGAPILAEYLGAAQSCDAYHMTEPHPEGLGVRMCITNALQDAGVAKEEVDYVNAHATSTPLGDMAEFRAVREVFGSHKDKLKMNATKSMIGHCMGAAGALEAVATIKAIQTGKLHPSVNIDNLEASVDIDVVPNVAQDHPVRVAISNSFGFGGHNSVVVFGKFDN